VRARLLFDSVVRGSERRVSARTRVCIRKLISAQLPRDDAQERILTKLA